MTPKSPKALRAAIYARQSVAEPEGIKRQVEACTALAASNPDHRGRFYVAARGTPAVNLSAAGESPVDEWNLGGAFDMLGR